MPVWSSRPISATRPTTLRTWRSGRRGDDCRSGVRLVKGAYWDTETVEAEARGWEAPVFENKAETDANYERLARQLHAHHGTLRAAFATHNVRSLAAAVVDGRRAGIPDNGYEVQLLYGMAEPVHEAVRLAGFRLRVYAPMGELVPGMAYLVRRLLENTSNESFVRHHFAAREGLDAVPVAPAPTAISGPPPAARREDTDEDNPGPYRPEPPAQWHRPEVLRVFRRRRRRRVRPTPSSCTRQRRGRFERYARSHHHVGRPGRPRHGGGGSGRLRSGRGRRRLGRGPRQRPGLEPGSRGASARCGVVSGGRRTSAGDDSTWRRWRCARRARVGPMPTPMCARPSTTASTTDA